MSWSYTADPLNNAIDELRLLIGDTDSSDPQLHDEEVQYFITTHSGVNQAAIAAITNLIAKYSRLADETTAELSIKWSQKSKAYRALKDDLSDPISSSAPVSYGGGVSNSDISTRRSNDNRFDEAFQIGMMDNSKSC
tara:strand:+ start:808 stop:1218 length:411 start_codon:yes stop_codon:yes gene_type:complete